MILSSHIIVATAIATPFAVKSTSPSSTVVIFIVAFCSHYILDLIPHWDYKLQSIQTCHRGEEKGHIKKDDLKKDLMRMIIDGLLGISVSFVLLSLSSFSMSEKLITLAIIIPASLLPDFMELVNIFFKKQPIAFFHKIHTFFHRKNVFIGKPSKGVPLQIIVILLIISLSFIL